MTTTLLNFCNQIWKSVKWPQNWTRSLVITLPKKGDLKLCNNYRTLSLISDPSKVLLRVLLNRLKHQAKEIIAEEQAGFMKGRSTVKLECHSRRGNLKFFGIKERENETNNDSELALREFIRTKLKILPGDEKNIHFDRVHRITSRYSQSNGQSLKPRPIIVRLTDFQDKFFIKSFIKNLPRGTGFGISDDFPKEVDEVRKLLYPILKAAKREKKNAYFNVEKLIINGALYRGEETSQFSFYGRLMDN